MYKNFIFDFYGTLVDIKTDEGKEILWEKMSMFYSYNGAKYNAAELRDSYHRRVSEKLKEITGTNHPDIHIEKVFQELYSAKGVEPSAELISVTCRLFRLQSTEYLFPYARTQETLDYLKSRGKKIYLLSNAQSEFTIPEMKTMGLYDKFDGIFISSDHEMSKPEPKFMMALVERFGLKAEESVMIGNDLTTDVEVAYRTGIDGIYLHTNHSNKKSVKKITRNGVTKYYENTEIKAKHRIFSGDIGEVMGFVR